MSELRNFRNVCCVISEAFDLNYAAHNATLLFAFLTDSEFSQLHVEAITDHGFEGYQDLAVLYGEIEETDRQRTLRECQEFADEIAPLLEGGRRSNRAEINRILDRRTSECEFRSEEIEALTNQVNLCNIDWPSYVEAVRNSFAGTLLTLKEKATTRIGHRDV